MENFFAKAGLPRIDAILGLKTFANKVQQNSSKDIFELKNDLKTLASEDFLKELVNYELEQLNNKTVYVPNPASFSFINLIDCGYCTMSLYYSQNLDFSNQKVCSGFAANRLIVSLSEGEVIYDLFRQPDPMPLDVLDKNKKMILEKQDTSLKNGDVMALNSHEDIIIFKKASADPMILLILTSKFESAFLWEYDMETLEPKQIITGDTISSRLEHTLRLLGEMGNFDSIEYLRGFLDYQDYNVRWEAAKAIMLIDFDNGVEALEYLKTDTHPQIQLSVKIALEQVANLINA